MKEPAMPTTARRSAGDNGVPANADQLDEENKMNDPVEPATVDVPVELLKELIATARDSDLRHLDAADKAIALLPNLKPRPRLVAVDLDGSLVDNYGLVDLVNLETQPDLLTLLDEAIDDVRNDSPFDGLHISRSDAKARIRIALSMHEEDCDWWEVEEETHGDCTCWKAGL